MTVECVDPHCTSHERVFCIRSVEFTRHQLNGGKSLNLVANVGRVERQRAVNVLLLFVRYRLVSSRRLRWKEPPRHEPCQPKYPCTWQHRPITALAPADIGSRALRFNDHYCQSTCRSNVTLSFCLSVCPQLVLLLRSAGFHEIFLCRIYVTM